MMRAMAVKEDDYENLKKSAEKRRLGMRKRKLEALLTSKTPFRQQHLGKCWTTQQFRGSKRSQGRSRRYRETRPIQPQKKEKMVKEEVLDL